MIRVRTGEVVSITGSRPGVTELEVYVEEDRYRAVNYDDLTGPVQPGDRVILNTTAVHKGLGTGGYHFVLANVSRPGHEAGSEGHIMKLRYTPSQVKVLSVEEQDSPYAGVMAGARSLDGVPVIAGTLHSMLAPAAAAVQRECRYSARVAYIMTDGAALPLPLSKLVKQLRDRGLVQATITCGHAFGGDYEAVTLYSALLAARAVARADVIIVCMGPGVVGTASPYGFTGVEQGEIINAVNILEGQPVAIPRLSFADRRERHYGLSHHTATALGKIALTPCRVSLPVMDPGRAEIVQKQLAESGITGRHRVIEIDGSRGLQALAETGIKVTTMGRTVEEDPEFFLAASAAGVLAARLM